MDALQVDVGTISAFAGAGGAYLVSGQAVSVGSVSASVAQVNLDGGTSVVADASQSGLLAGSGGNVVLQVGIGDLALAGTAA